MGGAVAGQGLALVGGVLYDITADALRAGAGAVGKMDLSVPSMTMPGMESIGRAGAGVKAAGRAAGSRAMTMLGDAGAKVGVQPGFGFGFGVSAPRVPSSVRRVAMRVSLVGT